MSAFFARLMALLMQPVFVSRAATAAAPALAPALEVMPPAPAPAPLLGLVVWRAEHLPAAWRDILPAQGWDFISCKVLNGRSAYPGGAGLIRQLQDLGITTHGWGYHYCQTVEQAELEGRAAGRVCTELGLMSYHWDAEDQWRDAGDCTATALAFARAFRAAAPAGARLWNNALHAPLTAEAMQAYDVHEPQCYGTLAATCASHWSPPKGRLHKFAKLPAPMAAMVGTGRYDPVKEQVWGWFFDQGAVPGLLTLATRERPYAISFFSSQHMLVTGNTHNPPLGAQVAALRAAFMEAS